MRLRICCILAVFAALAAAGCAAGPAATTSVPSSAQVLVSASAGASTGSVSDSKEMASPVVASSAVAVSQPQVYVTAAQLLNATDGAIVVKDCPAQGSCTFRVDITSDGGATWRRGRDFVSADAADNGSPSVEDPIIGLTMVSASDMFAYGASVWHTSDAGATWTQLSGAPAVDDIASSNGAVWAMVACPDLSHCASSIDTISSGYLTPLPHQPGGLVGSNIREGTNAYAVLRDAGGVGALAVSHDDGTTWQQRSLPQKYCTYSLGPAMTITTAGVLYLVCAHGASAGGEQKDLFASDNGAVSWQHLAALEIEGYADAIIAVSPDIFVALRGTHADLQQLRCREDLARRTRRQGRRCCRPDDASLCRGRHERAGIRVRTTTKPTKPDLHRSLDDQRISQHRRRRELANQPA